MNSDANPIGKFRGMDFDILPEQREVINDTVSDETQDEIEIDFSDGLEETGESF